jgi:ubiquinone/menaquinone biosynthesis C-methylase UbiE
VDEPTQSSKDRAAVAGHFTRIADAYRQYWSAALLPASRHLIDMFTMVNARAVVDVGAGVGSLYSTLSSAAPQARVVLTDRAEGMLRLSTSAADRAVADADRLPFRDGSFDVAILAFMLQYVEDPRHTLREARRVLRPGGHAGVLVWGATAESEAEQLWLAALDDAGAPEAGRLATYYDAVDSPDKLRGVLTDAGYTYVDVRVVPWSDHPDLETFVNRHEVLGVSGRRLAMWDPQRRGAFVARMRNRLGGLEPDAFLDRSQVLAATCHD